MRIVFFILFLFFFLVANAETGGIRISELPLGNPANVSANDSFPFVDSVNSQTKRLRISDILNVPLLKPSLLPNQTGNSGSVLTTNGTNPSWSLLSNSHIANNAGIVYSKLSLSNSIMNSDIAANAAISVSKLMALTQDRVLVTDSSGTISPSSVTSTELTALSGATDNIQDHIDSASAHGVEGDIVGTTDAQVLTNKDIDGGTASNTSRITLPKETKDNLDSLDRKEATLVYATDRKRVFVDDGDSLKELGSGGESGKNYIENGKSEAGLEGWRTYNDYPLSTGQGTPVTGAGDLGNQPSFSVNTTDPLSGESDFKVSDTTANGGVGVSYEFEIDNSDKARILSISFNYRTNVKDGLGDELAVNAFSVWIYDRTNEELIHVTPKEIEKVIGLSGRFRGEFQTAHDSTSYRLIIHSQGLGETILGAENDLYFDDVFVGPEQRLIGVPVTEWQAWTPTSGFDNATHTGMMRRVGDTLEATFEIEFTSAPSTAGAISLPDGLTIDSSKIGFTGSRNAFMGFFTIDDADGLQVGGGMQVGTDNPSSISFVRFHTGGLSGAVTYASLSTSFLGVTLDTGDKIRGRFQVPILGWGSSVVMSDSADTRIVTAGAYRDGSSQSASAGGSTEVIFNTKRFDTHSGFDVSNGRYTAKVSGYYKILSGVRFTTTSSAPGTVSVFGRVNGSSDHDFGYWRHGQFSTSTPYTANVNFITWLNAGDYVSIFVTPTSNDVNINGTSGDNDITYFYAERLSGKSQIAASETVAAKYTTASGQTISTSETTIIYDTKVHDTHGAFNSSTGEFTCPISGLYAVSVTTQLNSSDTASNYRAGIKKNGTITKDNLTYQSNNSNAVPYVEVYDEIMCNAGEKITGFARSSTESRALATSHSRNVITIRRVGL